MRYSLIAFLCIGILSSSCQKYSFDLDKRLSYKRTQQLAGIWKATNFTGSYEHDGGECSAEIEYYVNADGNLIGDEAWSCFSYYNETPNPQTSSYSGTNRKESDWSIELSFSDKSYDHKLECTYSYVRKTISGYNTFDGDNANYSASESINIDLKQRFNVVYFTIFDQKYCIDWNDDNEMVLRHRRPFGEHYGYDMTITLEKQ